MALRDIEITVRGIVQGVGFRPFVYRLANALGIRGAVMNTSEGVRIAARGDEASLDAFLREIRENPPPLASIHSVEEKEGDAVSLDGFVIRQSETSSHRSAFVSPDIALCDDCLSELLDPRDFRYGYPFITCTNCGPRFSITDDIPYDRKNTSMAAFPMCRTCEGEYRDPDNRRFHAQPNACPACGPRIALMDNAGTIISYGPRDAAARAVALLREGKIVAIKGVGGYLIACDAGNDEALARLRRRKGRPFKPFALMAGSIGIVEGLAEVSPKERELLLSRERPIVLLKTRGLRAENLVSPGLTHLGFMLPYAPFQHILFEIDPAMVLVMTSGNIADEPIIHRDDEALARLSRVADYFVSYNREIVAQSDDSVLFVEDEVPFFIRRSRGYVPAPFPSRPVKEQLLATGGDLKNSFALAKEGIMVLGQYLGDLAMASGDEQFRRTLSHYMRIYDFSPTAVVSDLHPGYFTTAFADELEAKGLRRFAVQHHHAHIASVMEEHGLDGTVIGIAFDGTGYGPDGALWGSEFLLADRRSYERAAHFAEFSLPGGESAIRDVWKIGVSLLHGFSIEAPEILDTLPDADMVKEIIAKKINSPLSTSVGRLFDGVSALLGICRHASTEAEAAMLLEEAAFRGKGDAAPDAAPFDRKRGVIDTGHFVRRALDIAARRGAEEASLLFHRDIALTALRVAECLREEKNINVVALSGGAFQNRLLLRFIMDYLREKQFDVYVPSKIPFNDGGIAAGQIAIAREIMA